MADNALVLILLVAGPDPMVDAMKASAIKSLGAPSTVVVEIAPSRDDSAAMSFARSHDARVIADVRFADPQKTIAQLHVHVDSREGWLDDTIDFKPEDSDAEKARALGYALASMVTTLKPPVASSPSPSPPRPESHATVEAKPLPPRPSAYVFASGLGAIDGELMTVGGVGGAGIKVGRWGARIVGGARFGGVDPIDVRYRTLSLGAGPVVRLVRIGRAEVEIKGDALIQNHSFVRPDATRSRWIGAVDLLVEGLFPLGPTQVAVGLGAEAGFGATTLEVGSSVERISPLRALAVVGLRLDVGSL